MALMLFLLIITLPKENEIAVFYGNKTVKLVNNYVSGNIGYDETIDIIGYYFNVTENDIKINEAIKSVSDAIVDNDVDRIAKSKYALSLLLN